MSLEIEKQKREKSGEQGFSRPVSNELSSIWRDEVVRVESETGKEGYFGGVTAWL